MLWNESSSLSVRHFLPEIYVRHKETNEQTDRQTDRQIDRQNSPKIKCVSATRTKNTADYCRAPAHLRTLTAQYGNNMVVAEGRRNIENGNTVNKSLINEFYSNQVRIEASGQNPQLRYFWTVISQPAQ